MKKSPRGVALVEFVLILPMLLLLTVITTEFGRAMYQYNSLAKNVRNAVRHLSQNSAGDTTQIGVAKCLAVYGNSGCTAPALVPGLTTAMVSVCDASSCVGTHFNQPTGSGAVNLASVTISGYLYTSLVPSLVPDITFGDISATMRQ